MPEEPVTDRQLSELQKAIFPDCGPGITHEQFMELAVAHRQNSRLFDKIQKALNDGGFSISAVRRAATLE